MSKALLAVFPLLLAAGLTGCGENPATAENVTETESSVAVEHGDVMDTQAPAANTAAPVAAETLPAKSQPTSVTVLPLKRGYYVASDTPCDQASNATVLLLRRNGIGGARDFCEFEKIEKIGANSYRVTQACGDLQDSTSSETITATYTLMGDTAFTSKRTDGWGHSARYCAQSAMPPDWRANDISEVTD